MIKRSPGSANISRQWLRLLTSQFLTWLTPGVPMMSRSPGTDISRPWLRLPTRRSTASDPLRLVAWSRILLSSCDGMQYGFYLLVCTLKKILEMLTNQSPDVPVVQIIDILRLKICAISQRHHFFIWPLLKEIWYPLILRLSRIDFSLYWD